ncbi:Ti-type conjugative transfer relaxase TraA [Sphingomonas nostoxanthinifaciens]|uniref:Ti-type conjugative transfer relaxase TraA n=1 Tax=Sphingomonas nostoxanthinifaciens TaxID=2872652 RepID=UPI001CC1D5D7|nr:Ti-type conjugative transfer relaxase TraA [Sphingomonas nostoxanthinifaciens]UAK25300.1 Ti-type conjugative transfer relaxase TraA [Sphingomonas nostoxanthinifaciens]
MAIYHFSAKVMGRGTGRSAIASAAYRSASRLHDERLGRHHDFTNKAGVVHSEVLLPEGAPERLRDRETLWNEVEATEKRKDAQFAREVEFAIPREMTPAQGVALARDFVSREFVERGMVADLNVHWDIGPDGEAKPHAHVMLTMREVGPDGFGPKVREWNATVLLQSWRENWASHVNDRLAQLGIEVRIDHRSYDAQGIELEPQHKIGAAGARREAKGEEAERAQDHRAIARDNGAAIIANPSVGLETLTRSQATFTVRDLAMFAHRHSDGQEQFDRVLASMRHHESVLALGRDGHGAERFTTTSMLSAERALERDAERLAQMRDHAVSRTDVGRAVESAEARGMRLGAEQRAAFDHVLRKPGLALVVGYAGAGKSAMLGVAREAWEAAGYTVRGGALSGIAAENLEGGSGITSRTIASLEHSWARDRDRLTSRDVLVVDEAGMIGTRQLQRVLAEAAGGGAKVVMVGDAQQLQAIEAGAAFRLLAERHGAAEIGEVRRQAAAWMREATRDFATGRTGEALAAYGHAGMVHAADTRDAARAALIDRWDMERRDAPAAARIILTHTNQEVQMLNRAARERLHAQGELGADEAVRTERGLREFADNDRILFLKNEREFGVKNGTLGIIEKAAPDNLAVRLDDGRRIDVDLKSYAHVDHGYAATVHKTQGMTVDRTYVLATPGLDAHSSYVALSRHRDGTALHYGRDDFADETALRQTLGRERPKDMALDYDRPTAPAAGRQQPAATARAPGNAESSTPPENSRGLAALVSRTFGRTGDERTSAPVPARDADRAVNTQAASVAAQDTGKDQERANARAVSSAKAADVGRSADPANSDQAKALRAMMAARNAAPRQTSESMREAMAAAKTAPAATRDKDYGAER